MAQPTQTGFFNAWLASMQGSNWNINEGTSSFLDDFIAPSFGYDPNMDGIWGNEDTPLSESTHVPYFPQFDWTNVEAAQEQFYETIGSVPGSSSGYNAFDWETLAHLDPEYADSLISGYGTGTSQEFGGNIGSQYGMDMNQARTSYIESARTEREAVRKSTKTLYGNMGHQSGTSGAILKSGEAFSNIGKELEAGERTSETIGSTFKVSSASAFADFDQDLNQALSDYLGVISAERTIFFQDTMAAVQDMGVTLNADGSGEGIFSGGMGQEMPEELMNALTPPDAMPTWWDAEAGEEYVPTPGEGYVQCADNSIVWNYEECPESVTINCPEGQIQVGAACQPIEGTFEGGETDIIIDPDAYDEAANMGCAEGQFWDAEEDTCITPSDEWLESDQYLCSAGAGQWDAATQTCNYAPVNEEGDFMFEYDGQAWDVICPPGMVPFAIDGNAGCVPEAGYDQYQGLWTEAGGVNAVSDADYQFWQETFSETYSYEEWFGGPTGAGYTDFYCNLNPYNPACSDIEGGGGDGEDSEYTDGPFSGGSPVPGSQYELNDTCADDYDHSLQAGNMCIDYWEEQVGYHTAGCWEACQHSAQACNMCMDS